MSHPSGPGDSLVALPRLLEEARQMLAASDARGDAEAETLLADIETCAVAAHRLVLRRRIEREGR